MDEASQGAGRALYVGTEIGGRWWKRYRAPSGFCFADRPSADAFVAEIEARRSDAG